MKNHRNCKFTVVELNIYWIHVQYSVYGKKFGTELCVLVLVRGRTCKVSSNMGNITK